MNPWRILLSDGIQALCKADTDIEQVIAFRFEEIIALLDRYVGEIELFNNAYGLVGVKNSEELVIKHILDSLAPLGIIYRSLKAANGDEKNLQIADAGSGAGLPGIPLAITLPDYNFTLIERMGRRAGFLWNTKAVLGLSNITVEEGELEKTSGGRFSLITFRAFKPLEPKLMTALINACTEKGIIAAYKGRREKIEQEVSKFKNNNTIITERRTHNWEIFPYNVPNLNEERHLLIIHT